MAACMMPDAWAWRAWAWMPQAHAWEGAAWACWAHAPDTDTGGEHRPRAQASDPMHSMPIPHTLRNRGTVAPLSPYRSKAHARAGGIYSGLEGTGKKIFD